MYLARIAQLSLAPDITFHLSSSSPFTTTLHSRKQIAAHTTQANNNKSHAEPPQISNLDRLVTYLGCFRLTRNVYDCIKVLHGHAEHVTDYLLLLRQFTCYQIIDTAEFLCAKTKSSSFH